MIYKKSDAQIQTDTSTVEALIKKRNHQFISGLFINRKSELIVFCPLHNETHTTTFYNYARSVIGMNCCARERKSTSLLNRTFSQETREKISKAVILATNRRHGLKPKLTKERKKKIRSRMSEWRRKVLAKNHYKCAVTGLKIRRKDGSDRKIIAHHCYNQRQFPQLSLDPYFGIPLIESIHVEFHKECPRNATIDNFLGYLDKFLSLSTPISRQANLEKFDGSETRAYDPERIKKLQERLKEFKTVFLKIVRSTDL
jgi:hypothetical protein